MIKNSNNIPNKTNSNHQFHSSVLRAYDIRGIVGETISEEDAYHIGRAFAIYIAKDAGTDIDKLEIAVGYDGRNSSPALQESLCAGICSVGANVVRVGLGPTPMLYFATRHLKLDGGIMVTGSHNPPTHNGFKLMKSKAALFGDEILQLGEIAKNSDLSAHFDNINAQNNVVTGEITENNSLKQDYIDNLLSSDLLKSGKDIKIVWDAGNGAAGEIMAEIAQKIRDENIVLFEEIDGNFPNHHPDPSVVENMQDLIAAVKNNNYDIGIAFDGDGDRIGVVDNDGNMIYGDQLMAIYARAILKDNPGATIIADVKASDLLFDDIRQHGGKPFMWKTGHSLIKSKMAEIGSPFAGEMSGHIFFADRYYGFDDGLYAAIRIIEILRHSNESLAEIVASLPVAVGTAEIRIECPEERKFDIITEISNRLKEANEDFNDIDGVRVSYNKDGNSGWWLVRASNTQAALVARCEANSEEYLAQLKDALRTQLELSAVKFQF